MAIMRVSRSASVIALCAVAWLPACATTTAENEIRKLEARASYEAGVKSIAEGRISLGLASLRQAVEIEPSNPIYHNAVGAVLLNIGRVQDAEAEFQKAVDADPAGAAGYFYLGYTVYKIAEPKRPFHPEKRRAAELFAKAYDLDPGFRPVWAGRR